MNKSLFSIGLALILVSCVNVEKGNEAGKRHYELEGESNFRDLGGYKTKDGKTIKWGTVFRSGKLSNLTESDVEILDSLGVKTVVNFLTPEEIEYAGVDQLPASTNSVYCPVDADADWTVILLEARKTGDFSRVSADLNPEFHRMLVDVARDQYARLFRKIIEEGTSPLVFHCSHGIHRTGTAAALLMWYLGVPWETVREDYLLSNVYRAEEIELRLNALNALADKNADIVNREENSKNIEAFYVLQGAYLDGTKETVEKLYGSIENYMSEGLGLTDQELARLQDLLLE